MKPIHRSQLVTIIIPANAAIGSKFFFPDIPELRDALVDGLETYTADTLAADLSGVDTVDTASLGMLTLSLVQESDRRAMDIPAFSLASNNYGGIWKEFDGWKLNWQKCYVQLTDTFGALQKSFSMNVFYHYGR